MSLKYLQFSQSVHKVVVEIFWCKSRETYFREFIFSGKN